LCVLDGRYKKLVRGETPFGGSLSGRFKATGRITAIVIVTGLPGHTFRNHLNICIDQVGATQIPNTD